MTPSNPTSGATLVTVLPEADRLEMCRTWGINPEARWPEAHCRADDAAEFDYYGEAGWDDLTKAERELEELGFVLAGGWHVATVAEGGGRDGGMTSHRGVLHPHEYVDRATLQARIEERLGFTFEQVRSVYRQGPLGAAGRELRARIDARLLELSSAGGNLSLLGRAIGFPLKADGHVRVIENALARARDAQVMA